MAKMFGYDDRGRDCTAIASQDATIFIMSITEVNKIKKKFPKIFEEMK
jgi:hypothetical protein